MNMKFKIPYANNFYTHEPEGFVFFLFDFPQLKELQCLGIISHITLLFFFFFKFTLLLEN